MLAIAMKSEYNYDIDFLKVLFMLAIHELEEIYIGDLTQFQISKFAYFCDKLECDLQSKLYDEEQCVDLTNQEGNISFSNKEVQELLAKENSWSSMWLEFGQKKYNYDQNFKEVSNYVKNNSIKQYIER